MGTKYTRLYKLSWLEDKVKVAADLGKVIKEDILIAEFISFFGSTRKTALELLRTLELTLKIVREFGEVWTKQKYDEQKSLETSSELKNNLEAKPENG